mmetsp:Transcript_6504/g.24188  ORF Transcript_6504/g.24188 Transcript_6504/m.24188 type:complete len:203 (-) Transcript_6504:50-658(-)
MLSSIWRSWAPYCWYRSFRLEVCMKLSPGCCSSSSTRLRSCLMCSSASCEKLLYTLASREAGSTEPSRRTGSPMRTTLFFRNARSFSTRLSTAMLEAEQTSTLEPRLTSCRMYSTTAVVLPVPGGPWMTATSFAASAKRTACCWLASSIWLRKRRGAAAAAEEEEEEVGGASPKRTRTRGAAGCAAPREGSASRSMASCWRT